MKKHLFFTYALAEYDEVSAGHTYTEYQEAKNLFRAIQESMLPFRANKKALP